MSLPLETLASGHFEPLLGSVFRMLPAADEPVALELAEVNVLGHRRSEAARDPFSLIFRGPTGQRYGQGMAVLEHAELGRMELFLTQIADRPDGSVFEAIFT